MQRILLGICCAFMLFMSNGIDAQGPTHPNAEQKLMMAQGLLPTPESEPVATSFPSNHFFLKTNTICQPEEQGCMIPVDYDTWTRVVFSSFDGTNGWTCDDCASDFIPFDFEYSVCGSPYEGCYINTNGNLTFDIPFTTFTPQGIPNNLAVMVAPYWSDIDIGQCGEIWMELTSTHLIVAWVEVGYFNEMCDKKATFEVVITNGNDPIIGIGNNTAFYYCDIDFTTGAASEGIDGFGGSPATVGINANNDNSFALIGRFDHPGTDYDGPLGDVDGCDFLDDKFYLFSAAECAIESSCSLFDLEINPTICDGTSYELDVSFVPAGVGPTAFMVSIDGETYGPFSYGAQGSVTTVTIPDLPGNGQMGIQVYVFDLDNDGCGTDCVFDAPACVPVCELSNLTLVEGDCVGTNFNLTVNFDYAEVTDGFTILAGGNSYGPYAYTDLPVVLTLPGNDINDIPLYVNDLNTPNCGVEGSFDALFCEIPCVISDLTAQVSACSGTSYGLTINFNSSETSANFSISIGGVDYGVHPYTSLPLTFTLPGDASANNVVSVSDVGIAGCSASISYDAPLCCGSTPGLMSSSAQYICAGGSASSQAQGSVVQPSHVLIYVLHTLPGSSLGTVLATNSTGIFSQGGSSINTQYYISAIVGPSNGAGGVNMDSPCTVVAPGTPVVFLSPVTILINESCDWEFTGDFSLTLSADGGLPDFLAGASYTIAGTNLNSVAFLADQSVSIMLGQFDGLTYSYTCQDGVGCAATRSETVICYKTPIELIEFSGRAEGAANLIHWTTGSETDNDYFTLERSVDGQDFETIAIIDGAGNSIAEKHYQYLDEKVTNGLHYYRLTQTDYNGKYLTSEVILIERTGIATVFSIAPNPALNELAILPYSGLELQVKIFDIQGRLVSSTMSEQGKIPVNHLISGIYLVEILENGQKQIIRFVKD